MSRVEAAAGPDRLPWLEDEPVPQRVKRRGSAVLPWAAAAAAGVTGAGFWLGLKSADQVSSPAAQRATPTTTVRLPAPRAAIQPQVRIAPQPAVKPIPVPEFRPAPVREVRIARPAAPTPAQPRSEKAASTVKPDEPQSTVAAPATVRPIAQVTPRKPWNPRIVSGAAGRLVQIGAFGSTYQAKRGWWYMVRAYPAVARLPAVVRPARNSRGRIFYRFQVGTTSQAHSEVLCQRMQRIRFSCAVVDLPWKAKVER